MGFLQGLLKRVHRDYHKLMTQLQGTLNQVPSETWQDVREALGWWFFSSEKVLFTKWMFFYQDHPWLAENDLQEALAYFRKTGGGPPGSDGRMLSASHEMLPETLEVGRAPKPVSPNDLLPSVLWGSVLVLHALLFLRLRFLRRSEISPETPPSVTSDPHGDARRGLP